MAETDWIYKEFGRRLRQLREASKITQDILAERVGLSRTSITNIEKGRQHILLHTLFSFADVLGIPPADLLPERRAESTPDFIDKRLLEKALLSKEAEEYVKRVVSKRKEGEGNE